MLDAVQEFPDEHPLPAAEMPRDGTCSGAELLLEVTAEMVASRNRVYLVHIKLAQSDAATIRARAPLLHSAISSVSNQMIHAYSSADAGTFGFLVTSELGAYALRYDLENGGQDRRDTGFRTGDSVLVLEIGEHTSQLGFSRAQDFVEKWYAR